MWSSRALRPEVLRGQHSSLEAGARWHVLEEYGHSRKKQLKLALDRRHYILVSPIVAQEQMILLARGERKCGPLAGRAHEEGGELTALESLAKGLF